MEDLLIVLNKYKNVIGFAFFDDKFIHKKWGYYEFDGQKAIKVHGTYFIDELGIVKRYIEGKYTTIFSKEPVVDLHTADKHLLFLTKNGNMYYYDSNEIKLIYSNRRAIKCVWFNCCCRCSVLLDESVVIYKSIKDAFISPSPKLCRCLNINQVKIENTIVTKEDIFNKSHITPSGHVNISRRPFLTITEFLSKESLTYYQLAKIYTMMLCSPIRLPKFLYIKIIELIWMEYKIF